MQVGSEANAVLNVVFLHSIAAKLLHRRVSRARTLWFEKALLVVPITMGMVLIGSLQLLRHSGSHMSVSVHLLYLHFLNDTNRSFAMCSLVPLARLSTLALWGCQQSSKVHHAHSHCTIISCRSYYSRSNKLCKLLLPIIQYRSVTSLLL